MNRLRTLLVPLAFVSGVALGFAGGVMAPERTEELELVQGDAQPVTTPSQELSPVVAPSDAITAEVARDALSPREIARRALRWTVAITGDGVYGSGFLIDPRGYVLTSDHVIASMRSIHVSFAGGAPQRAEVLERDPKLDLALLAIAVDRGEAAPLAGALQAEVGDDVFTVGSPRRMEFSMSRGMVSYLGREVRGLYYLQTDLPTNGGNSGGPVINERGEVIGVMSFILKNSQGLAFATPIEYALERFATRLGGARPELSRFLDWKRTRLADS